MAWDSITNEDIAGLLDVAGQPEGAAVLRYAGRPDPDAQTVDDLAAEITGCLDEVPESATNTKHTDECWKKHAACLADRLRELLP
jgi:hypothetical protein